MGWWCGRRETSPSAVFLCRGVRLERALSAATRPAPRNKTTPASGPTGVARGDQVVGTRPRAADGTLQVPTTTISTRRLSFLVALGLLEPMPTALMLLMPFWLRYSRTALARASLSASLLLK